eukprot:TRINITY_DN52292_c0_g1_i1.p1 TRINITY_DN52292_c0_g1~~TRINITY_DN52292_c0_g1_i1.p1  ORF type:complete len:498 (+),score=97.25 TRINITY_DN52292_c0_g1_i1:67-1560(+)
MATAAEVRAELERVQGSVRTEVQRHVSLTQELGEAHERQRLRRQVDTANEALSNWRSRTQCLRLQREAVDADNQGPFVDDAFVTGCRIDASRKKGDHSSGQSEIDFKQAVSTCTYEWKIAGMSWSKHALEQADEDYLCASDIMAVGGLELAFEFCPWPDRRIDVGEDVCCFTLGIRPQTDFPPTPVAFRYRVYILRRDGEYVQWGGQGRECMNIIDMHDRVFGPDVTSGAQPAAGIFGLSHEELLQSEWINNDTLAVKFEVEVRPFTGTDSSRLCPEKPKPKVELPETSLSATLLTFFEEARCTDVTFKVKGESIRAHSQVLAMHSEVFERQFFGGLQESSSKEVVIEDVELNTFKIFLKFLYTNDLQHVREVNISSCRNMTGSLLQDLFALSHKYQVLCLIRWCEQELCKYITDEEVCSMLCQAHLCEAQHLQAACLSYVKKHMSRIMSTKDFAELTAKWPDVLMKISLHAAGISSEEAAAAMSAQQELRKRKRDM